VFDVRNVTSKANRSRVEPGRPTPTLHAGGLQVIEAARGWPAEIAPTLNAAYGKKWGLEDQNALNGGGMFAGPVPRRLTPTECERLQGFPDGWTERDAAGGRIADGPRYRMMGNAVTVTVAEWIGRRLLEAAA
jgi:DNA (cytosine-5)-methyltransferase 1